MASDSPKLVPLDLPKNVETPSEVIRSAYPTSLEVAVPVQQIAEGLLPPMITLLEDRELAPKRTERELRKTDLLKEGLSAPPLISLHCNPRSQKLYPTMRRNLGAGPEYKLVFSSANIPRRDCIPTRTLNPVS